MTDIIRKWPSCDIIDVLPIIVILCDDDVWCGIDGYCYDATVLLVVTDQRKVFVIIHWIVTDR